MGVVGPVAVITPIPVGLHFLGTQVSNYLGIEINCRKTDIVTDRCTFHSLYPTSLTNRWFLSVLGATAVSPSSRSNSSLEIS